MMALIKSERLSETELLRLKRLAEDDAMLLRGRDNETE